MSIGHKAVVLLLALALALASGAVTAQGYPTKPIKFIVGFPPGGATDVIGRMFAQRLAERIGQPVTVENKPGANGIIGAEYVVKAAPDGYTLLIGASGSMAYNVGLYYGRLPYDPLKDLSPIIVFASNPLVIAVHPSVPASSIKELIALAKAQPGKLFYASGTTAFQVSVELFKMQAGANLVHVPYKGSSPSVAATVAGDVQLVLVDIPASLAQIRAGKIRALAVTGSSRVAAMPDVPTVAESGMPNYEVILWTGLFAPAGTPAAIIDKLHSELSVVLKEDSLKERLGALGAFDTTLGSLSPAQFRAMHRADVNKWTKVARDLNIRAD
ncbi:MAG: tripartite tricarboxylate transporter substrate binding protein [Betaproteobacteria bacterium]|nr:tripartite tricarboxylate transporter substrate binding protein [Betaproteobacteria bacterium]